MRTLVYKHVKAQFPSKPFGGIAFVGEAPSDEETLRDKPLVGPAGRVYDHLLRAAGIDRDAYLTTNVFDFKLDGNEIRTICMSTEERKKLGNSYDLPKIGDKGYLRPDFIPQLDRLAAEIAAVRPTLIVPMGGTALWAFTGDTEILQARGAVEVASYIAAGIKILPVVHPAFVMREWRLFHVTVADLVKALHEATFPEIRTSHREIWTEPNIHDLDEFSRRYLRVARLQTWDIETSNNQIDCVGIGTGNGRAIVVPFINYDKPSRSYWPTLEDEAAAWKWLADIAAMDTPKLLQNGLYDQYWLWRYGIKLRNYRHDTRLLHHALYPELPKSLGFMGSMYANERNWKAMRGTKVGEKRDD